MSAIISYYGTTDLSEFAAEGLGGYLGVSPGENPDIVALASPISHVSADDPPVFLLWGTMDAYVPALQAESLYAALRDAGVACEYIVVQGAGHGGSTGFYGAAARAVRDFLDAYVRGDD